MKCHREFNNCAGSDCALFVAVLRTPDGLFIIDAAFTADPNEEAKREEHVGQETGLGVCRDNLHARPWEDPQNAWPAPGLPELPT